VSAEVEPEVGFFAVVADASVARYANVGPVSKEATIQPNGSWQTGLSYLQPPNDTGSDGR